MGAHPVDRKAAHSRAGDVSTMHVTSLCAEFWIPPSTSVAGESSDQGMVLRFGQRAEDA